MLVTTESELKALQKIGRIVALARDEMLKSIKPEITTKELDLIGEKILSKYGAKSAPIHEYGFPGTTCISVNDEVAHGIPGSRVIKEGDLVNVDVSAELGGYFADTGATRTVGKTKQIKKEICKVSKTALNKAINVVTAGTRINHIGTIIHNEAKRNGFTVIKNLSGHGIGKKLHEKPGNILNFYEILNNDKLKNGQVIALETFISTGAEFTTKMNDGWTLKTPDGSFVAQFEHTIVVTKNKPIILTVA